MTMSGTQTALTLPHLSRGIEQSVIKEALKRCREEGSVEIIFVSGVSGTGKSTLVSDVTSSYSADINSFWKATAKFDQRNTSAPFAALREALSSLIELASVTGGESWTEAIRTELSVAQLKTLSGFISSNRCLFPGEEKRPEEEDDSYIPYTFAEDVTADSLPVLVSTLRGTFRMITNLNPVLLCLDDMHWADALSLEVLQSLLSCSSLTNLFFCGTYRNDDKESYGHFTNWKPQLEKNTIHSLQTIQLNELDATAVQGLFSEATNLETEQVKELSDCIYNFTHGNFFYMKQMLNRLQDEGLLVFDAKRHCRWEWDVPEIKRRFSLADNVVKTLTARIHKLPHSTQDFLKLASCFGSQFDIRAMDKAKSALNLESVYDCLESVCQEEFVIQLSATRYKFSHDTIQLAAYSLLPKGDVQRQKFHWTVGCLLLENGGDLLQEESLLFATVDHLNIGYQRAVGGDFSDYTRTKIAKMDYRAGCIAASLSAFALAANYLKAGIAILGPKPFHDHYELAVQMYPLYAKTEYVMGEFSASKAAAQQVITHAQSWEEKETSLLVLLSCLAAHQDAQEMLVDQCFEILHAIGERIPRYPTAIQTQMEYMSTRSRLKKLSDKQLLTLHPMSDKRKEIITKILCQLVFPLYQLERELLSTAVACRLVKITLDHGLSSVAPEALALFGSHLVSNSSDIKEGYRFGNLALQLLKKQGGQGVSNSHVYIFIADFTKWWLEPLPSCLDVLVESNKLAMTSGDIGVAFKASIVYEVNYFYSGLALEPLLQDVEKFCGQYLQYEQHLSYFLATPLQQCLLNLTGRSDKPHSMEEGDAIAKRNSMRNPDNIGQQSIWSYGMQLAFYFGDLMKATELAAKVSHVRTGFMKSSFFTHCRTFFFALIAIANYKETHRRKDKSVASKHIKEFRKLVKAGAINLVHKLQLLEAELGSCSFKAWGSIFAKYEEAVISASRAGFVQDAALANYLCFHFMVRNSVNLHMAEMYAKKSVELWVSWGAVAVAESIMRRHPEFFSEDSLDEFIRDANKRDSFHRSRNRFDGSLSVQHQQLFV